VYKLQYANVSNLSVIATTDLYTYISR